MNEKISRALTVYVKGHSCNLQCPYCYVKNSNPNETPQSMFLKYPLDIMIRSFAPKRIGGIAEVTVIGSAETLLTKEVIPFVHGLLHYGHIVTVVSNATLSDRIDELLNCPKDDLKNLILKASFHYEELKKRKLLNVYFKNIKKVIDYGASAYPFVVISPEYSKHLKEIGELIKENLGCKAHCSPCNSINSEFDLRFHSQFDPKPTRELMKEIDQYFDTRIFRECVRYKDVDVQKTFCYAGRWSLGIDMATGQTYKCHGFRKDNEVFYNNVDKPYQWGGGTNRNELCH
jgi:pyruvate-formate lyase-activating enzyme